MSVLRSLYRPSLALLTDLYQITMAYGYWKNQMANHEAVFNLFFRKNPFKGGYAIAAGLEQAAELIQRARFDTSDLDYLATLKGNDNEPLFEDAFLRYLQESPNAIHLDAVPEGSVVFPHEPLLRLRGPIIPCQLLETPLLTMVNFQTLIATKSSRICRAAQGDLVLEFGLRRAQGIDGGLSASRAAFIGGCHATSNVQAGKLFDIPVKGTHAHAWVMMFPSELDSFSAYAKAMQNNCIFLVDTYDTVQGVHNAVKIGRTLREKGHQMVGVRLDSGDMADLSKKARVILDEGGFPDAKIVASDSLDERKIAALKEAGALIQVWGVGTNMVTAKDQPALGGVYKLAAVRAPGEDWQYKVKLSNTPIKVSNPGILQIRRFTDEKGLFLGDVLYDEDMGLSENPRAHSLTKAGFELSLSGSYTELLQPILRDGNPVWSPPSLADIRERAQRELDHLPSQLRAFNVDEPYFVGLKGQVNTLKNTLIAGAK
ncbi:MAG: nicotinate phosphoribosyltransferase [Myxococcota bacterium]|nr:nicotinate phosphoribosyltransferase [Myxococcota bacterium]